MLILWVALRQMQLPEEEAFVIVLVIAQAYAVWRNLPTAAASLQAVQRGMHRLLQWPVVVLLILSALQLWVSDPLFSQRLFSGFCVFFLIIMLMGLRREKNLLDRVAPMERFPNQTVKRISLLRINALIAAIVVSVNETLIVQDSLVVWISALPVCALIIHGMYWFMVLLVLPTPGRTELIKQ